MRSSHPNKPNLAYVCGRAEGLQANYTVGKVYLDDEEVVLIALDWH